MSKDWRVIRQLLGTWVRPLFSVKLFGFITSPTGQQEGRICLGANITFLTDDHKENRFRAISYCHQLPINKNYEFYLKTIIYKLIDIIIKFYTVIGNFSIYLTLSSLLIWIYIIPKHQEWINLIAKIVFIFFLHKVSKLMWANKTFVYYSTPNTKTISHLPNTRTFLHMCETLDMCVKTNISAISVYQKKNIDGLMR